MVVGETRSGLQSVAAGAYLDILPPATEEWVIHNIFHEDDVTVEQYDGTNSIVFATEAGADVYQPARFHVTTTRRIRVKNAAVSPKLIGYDGVLSVETLT